MYRLFTVEQVRELERRAIEEFNVSPKRLMKEAGKALAEYVQATVEQGSIAVICGSGNNGGDGWAAARYLHRHGRSVKVFSVHDPLELSGIAGKSLMKQLHAESLGSIAQNHLLQKNYKNMR